MNTMKKLGVLFLASTIFTPSLALADGDAAQPAPTATTQGTLDDLQDQIAVLTAQEKIASLKAQILTDNKGKDADPSSASPYPPLPVPGLMPTPPKTASAQGPVQAPMPVIMSIQGRGDNLSAMLLLPSGAQIMATRGADIGGGLMVHDVSANGVNVIQAGNLVPLQFEGEAPARAAAQ